MLVSNGMSPLCCLTPYIAGQNYSLISNIYLAKVVLLDTVSGRLKIKSLILDIHSTNLSPSLTTC